MAAPHVTASALAGMASGTFDPLLDRATTERSLDDRLLDLLESIIRTPAITTADRLTASLVP